MSMINKEIANPTHCIAKDVEVLIESDGLAERGTFIINSERKKTGTETLKSSLDLVGQL